MVVALSPTVAGWSTAQIQSQLSLGALLSCVLLWSSVRSHISLWYCLLCWSNWIPSVAYNESLLELFSLLKYLFLLNAGLPRIMRHNVKTCVCVPWLRAFFIYLSFTAASVSLLFQHRIMGLLLCLVPLQWKATSSGHSPHSTNCVLIWKVVLRWNVKADPFCLLHITRTLLPLSTHNYFHLSLHCPWHLTSTERADTELQLWVWVVWAVLPCSRISEFR